MDKVYLKRILLNGMENWFDFSKIIRLKRFLMCKYNLQPVNIRHKSNYNIYTYIPPEDILNCYKCNTCWKREWAAEKRVLAKSDFNGKSRQSFEEETLSLRQWIGKSTTGNECWLKQRGKKQERAEKQNYKHRSTHAQNKNKKTNTNSSKTESGRKATLTSRKLKL